jgi:hypothetical protein
MYEYYTLKTNRFYFDDTVLLIDRKKINIFCDNYLLFFLRWASHSTTLNHWPRNAKAPYIPLEVKGHTERDLLFFYIGIL